jgi:hypothetical protein
MIRVVPAALLAALAGCANLARPMPLKQHDRSIRFPRPGEVKQDPFPGPMLRAISVATQDIQRRLEREGAPRCLATPDGVDYMVGDGEMQLDANNNKKMTKVFYVSAWLNPKRCNVPESRFTEDGYDYIVTEDGRLLKAARLGHVE